MTYRQSCGMPLESKDLMGTNQDGSTQEEYCCHCYRNGAFIQDVTMEEMIKISLRHMRELFANDPTYCEEDAIARMLCFFPELKRWKQTTGR